LLVLVIAVPTSRPDRIAGAYPAMLAPGAVLLARDTARRLRRGFLALFAVSTVVLLPLALPLLQPSAPAAYAPALPINPQIERQRMTRVPQWVADRLGWPDLVDAITRVRAALPDGERGGDAFLAGDYGFAGALERYGAAAGITRVIGTHNQ